MSPTSADDLASGIIAVRLGRAEFGVPVLRVQEVVPTPRISKLPFAESSVFGIASLRGTIIPVLDLGDRLLGHAAARPGRLVIVEDRASRNLVGLLVDGVSGILAGPQEIDTPPPEAEAVLPAGWMIGVVALESDRLVTVLELDAVLNLSTAEEVA
ncbi:MAG TPA: chemotaxis protein CheW [Longimicrobiaceae bacterium]|nr:chemotaxis protein CheW [Longimicrobiaceae bacterium]